MTAYLLRGYASPDAINAVLTFESNNGPFTIGSDMVTSLNYDDREVVWLRRDPQTGMWFMDADDIGFPTPPEDRYIWITNFSITEKDGPDRAADQLDRIETRLIMIWNRLMRLAPSQAIEAELEALTEVHDEAITLHHQARDLANV